MIENFYTLFRALLAGLDALTHFLDNPTTQQANFVTLSLPSGDAINKALDVSPHDNQEVSIAILKRLSTIFDSKPDTKIVFLWLPRKIPFAGFKRMKQIALEAIRTADLTDIIEPHTINRQKETTKDAAVAEWAAQWHQSPHTSNSVAKLALSRFYILINKIVQNLKIFEYIDKLNSWGVLCQL